MRRLNQQHFHIPCCLFFPDAVLGTRVAAGTPGAVSLVWPNFSAEAEGREGTGLPFGVA